MPLRIRPPAISQDHGSFRFPGVKVKTDDHIQRSIVTVIDDDTDGLDVTSIGWASTHLGTRETDDYSALQTWSQRGAGDNKGSIGLGFGAYYDPENDAFKGQSDDFPGLVIRSLPGVGGKAQMLWSYLPSGSSGGAGLRSFARFVHDGTKATAVLGGSGTLPSAPDGLLHLFESTAGAVQANASGRTLVLEGGADVGLSFLTPDDHWAGFYWGSPSNNKYAGVSARYNLGHMDIGGYLTSIAFNNQNVRRVLISGSHVKFDDILSGTTLQFASAAFEDDQGSHPADPNFVFIDGVGRGVTFGATGTPASTVPHLVGIYNNADLHGYRYPFEVIQEGGNNIIRSLALHDDGSNAGAGWVAHGARGTLATPEAIQSGDRLAFFLAGGYDVVDAWRNSVGIEFWANEDFTGSAGSYMRFLTTPDGGTTRQDRGRITADGAWQFETNLTLKELASDPSNPPSGYQRVYARNDGKVYMRTSGGTVYDLTSTGTA